MSLKQFLENVLVLLSVKVVANFFGYIYVMLVIAPSNANSTVKCIIRASASAISPVDETDVQVIIRTQGISQKKHNLCQTISLSFFLSISNHLS